MDEVYMKKKSYMIAIPKYEEELKDIALIVSRLKETKSFKGHKSDNVLSEQHTVEGTITEVNEYSLIERWFSLSWYNVNKNSLASSFGNIDPSMEGATNSITHENNKLKVLYG